MKVLHICNDFLGSRVHANLYIELNRLSIQQIVYFPLRPLKPWKSGDKNNIYDVIIGLRLKRHHKVLFRKKIWDLYQDLCTKIDYKTIDLIHATTLFSDGALAYKVYKNHGIPYMVSVRNVDVDYFLKLRPDLYFLVRNILLNAEKIIFISNSLRDNFFKHPFIKRLKAKVINTTETIYNGVDAYWLNHRTMVLKNTPTKILYVGTFEDRKNVLRLIRAFLKLKKDNPELELNLVGKTGNQFERIKRFSNKQENKVNYLGPVYDKEKLLEIYRSNHIFAMVSKRETFGLVYMEALSQGLPLLFTKSQGVDGLFKERIGEAVNPYSVNSIKKGLNKILTNYEQYNTNVDFSDFHWPGIAKKYQLLYQEIIQLSSH